ncbi:MAG: hypothetical protein JXO22_11680 [Phycisphaerae bacterium]|nr:hypothetical protein [Phycisphaerae bacterium]
MRRFGLHWIFRVGVATFIASVYGGLSVAGRWRVHWDISRAVMKAFDVGEGVSGPVAWFAPIILLALGCHGVLTLWLGPARQSDGETRCRRCGYILRGLVEPRCSECGERI